MKKFLDSNIYTSPIIEFIEFEFDDVISTSGQCQFHISCPGNTD